MTLLWLMAWVGIVLVFWLSSGWLVDSLPTVSHRRINLGIRVFVGVCLLGYFIFRTSKSWVALRDTEL